MLTQKKQEWYRYLIETLVVVVSILVAFSLENWRDKRKDLREEIIILRSLQSEFQESRERLDSIIGSEERTIELKKKGNVIYNNDTLVGHCRKTVNEVVERMRKELEINLLSITQLKILENTENTLKQLSAKQLYWVNDNFKKDEEGNKRLAICKKYFANWKKEEIFKIAVGFEKEFLPVCVEEIHEEGWNINKVHAINKNLSLDQLKACVSKIKDWSNVFIRDKASKIPADLLRITVNENWSYKTAKAVKDNLYNNKTEKDWEKIEICKNFINDWGEKKIQLTSQAGIFQLALLVEYFKDLDDYQIEAVIKCSPQVIKKILESNLLLNLKPRLIEAITVYGYDKIFPHIEQLNAGGKDAPFFNNNLLILLDDKKSV